MQVELRRRLAQGLQFQTSYVFGEAMATSFFRIAGSWSGSATPAIRAT